MAINNKPKEERKGPENSNTAKSGKQPKQQQGGGQKPPSKSNKSQTLPINETQIPKDDSSNGISFSDEANATSSEGSSSKIEFPGQICYGSQANQSTNTIRDSEGGFGPFVKLEFVKVRPEGIPGSPLVNAMMAGAEQFLNMLKSKTLQPTSTTTLAVSMSDVVTYAAFQMNLACFIWMVSFGYGISKEYSDQSIQVPYTFFNSISQNAGGARFNTSTMAGLNDLSRAFYINKNVKSWTGAFFGNYLLSTLNDGVARIKMVLPLCDLELITGGKEFDIPATKDKPARKGKLPTEWTLVSSDDLVLAQLIVRGGLGSVNLNDPRLLSVLRVQAFLNECFNFPEAVPVYKSSYDLTDAKEFASTKLFNNHISIFERNRDMPIIVNRQLMHTNTIPGNSLVLYAQTGVKLMNIDFALCSQYRINPATMMYTPLVGLIENSTTERFLKDVPTEWFINGSYRLDSTSFENETATFRRRLRLSKAGPTFRIQIDYDNYSLWRFDSSNISAMLDDLVKYILCFHELNNLERP